MAELFGLQFKRVNKAPLDVDEVLNTEQELTDLLSATNNGAGNLYEGFITYVKDSKVIYVIKENSGSLFKQAIASGGSGSTTLIDNVTAKTAVGGIEENDIIQSGTSFTGFVQLLLDNSFYIRPEFSISVEIGGNDVNKAIERNATISQLDITVDVVVNDAENLNEVYLKYPTSTGTANTSIASVTSNTQTLSFTITDADTSLLDGFSQPFQIDVITTYDSPAVDVNDPTGGESIFPAVDDGVVESYVIDPVYPFLYGVRPFQETPVIGSDIYDNAIKLASKAVNQTIEFAGTSTNDQIYIGYPKAYGKLFNIRDTSSGISRINDFENNGEPYEVTVDGPTGNLYNPAQDYYFYIGNVSTPTELALDILFNNPLAGSGNLQEGGQFDVDLTYDGELPTISLGGVNPGENIIGLTANEILEKILVKYQPPSVSITQVDDLSNSISDIPGTVEVGTTLGPNFNITYTVSQDQNVSDLFISNSIVTADELISTSSGTESDSTGSAITLAKGQNIQFTITGTNTEGGSISESYNIVAQYKKYYGNALLSAIGGTINMNGSQVVAESKSPVFGSLSGRSFTLNTSERNVYFIAIEVNSDPYNIGDAIARSTANETFSVTDDNTLITNSFYKEPTPISIADASGTATDYNLYRLAPTTTPNETITIL